jgi:hypothetical protein
MWQANLCAFLCNYEIASMKVCCDFLECLSYFIVDDLILLFVAFVELLGLVDAFFYCLWIFLVVCVFFVKMSFVFS